VRYLLEEVDIIKSRIQHYRRVGRTTINMEEDEIADHKFAEQLQPPLKRTRGVNLQWKQITIHDNLESALNLYSAEKMLERDLIKGKVVRTKTAVYNFSCGKKTCGCPKQYRISTVQCSVEVIEEETVDDHSNHDQHQRNNGRGLSYAQSDIIEEALKENMKKPQQVYTYFSTVEELGIKREGRQMCTHA
jgi:hypothetical protein